MANDHDHGGVNSPQGQQIQYTEEELHLLRQLRREGAMTRGYPAAALTSGLTYFWMRKLPNVSRSLKVVTTIIAGSLAHTAGMLSFYPTAKNRLMEQLPQDSQLRQMFQDLDAIKNDPNHRINSHNIASAPLIENPAQFQPSDGASEYQEPERDYKEPPRDYPAYQAPSDTATAEEEKKPFSSYEELRRRNRSPHSSPYSPPVSAPEPPPPQQYTDYEDNSEQPPTPMPEVRAPRKRYNKYGDEILD